MEAARRVSAFNRLSERRMKNIVCRYWLEGRCQKNPCRFMHAQTDHLPRVAPHRKQPRNLSWKNPKITKKAPTSGNGGMSNSKSKVTVVEETTTAYTERDSGTVTQPKAERDSGTEAQPKVLTPGRLEREKSGVQKAQPKQCKYWISGNCVDGDECKDMHSWFCGSGYTMLAKLEGHTKAITGISLPSGADKLYSGGKDGIVRVWDCNNGQSAGAANMDSEVGCLVTKGQWLFAGVQNGVKAWDLQNYTEFFLNGSTGLVCSIIMNNEYDKLFAGMEDGTIVVWKQHPEKKKFEAPTMLKEHKGAVRSLVVGADRLYSSSADSTIKVWDLQNYQCLQTLRGHTKDVTSVLCWDNYLLSASLDNTLKVWATTENGTIGMVYEIKDDYEVLALCGIHDAEAKPILLTSFSDNTVRLYNLPSFAERGRIFSKSRVEAIQIGVDGLFFTGDATGEICIWKLLGEPGIIGC